MKKNELQYKYDFIKEKSDELLNNNLELKNILDLNKNIINIEKCKEEEVTYTAGTLNAYMG